MTAAVAPVRATSAAGGLDLAVVAVLAGVGLTGLHPVFGGPAYLPAAATGVLAGLAIGWFGAWRRWGALSVAMATVLGFFLLGGPVAFPTTLTFGVVPSVETLVSLTTGAVGCWKGIITVAPPVTTFHELTLVPFLAGLVTCVLAASFALRLRRSGWAVVPLAGLLIGTILLGTSQTVAPVAQGGSFGIVVVGWLAWRRASARAVAHPSARDGAEGAADHRRLRMRTLRRAGVMVAGVGVVVGLAGPAIVGAEGRYVLRDAVEPPPDIHEYPSPLEAFRRYVKDEEQTVLFTVTDLPPGARLRLAVLDTYTGHVIDVAGGDRSATGASGSFENAGEDLVTESTRLPEGAAASIAVTVGAYEGVWVPTIGVPTSLVFSGPRTADLSTALFTNAETGTVLSTAGLAAGDTYTVGAVVPSVPSADAVPGTAAASTFTGSDYAVGSAAAIARTFIGPEARAAAQLLEIRDALSTGGVFSDGLDGQLPSRAGHGAQRIETLLAGDQMVGDDEQFAVTAALMARSLGHRARVVLGFYPDPAAPALTPDGATEIRGTDTHAWVEVAFDGIGWVTYDVTPDENQPPQAQDPRSVSEPEVQLLQEPPAAEVPDEALAPPISAQDAAAEEDSPPETGSPLAAIGIVTVSVLLVLAPLAAVVAAKGRRRRRRRAATEPVDRMSGAWREVADAAIDLGAVLVPGATRQESARQLGTTYRSPATVTLAAHVDRAVFGAEQPTDQQIADLWAEVDRLIGDLHGAARPWDRVRARLSPRSLGLRQQIREASAHVVARPRRRRTP